MGRRGVSHEPDEFEMSGPVSRPGSGRADLGLLAMAAIWGINFPVIKASLSAIPPMAFNALRFPLACVTVFLILRGTGRIPWPRRGDWLPLIGLGLMGNVVYQLFFIIGLNGTLAGNASVLLATIPVWTLIFSTLSRQEDPGAQVWAGIVITVAGIVLVVMGGGDRIGFQGSSLRGDLLIVGGAAAWSLYTVGSRGLIQRYGSLPMTAWTLWIGSPVLVLLGLPSLRDTNLPAVPASAWFGVVYAGVFAIGLAYILWYRGVQQIGSSRTAAYQNLVPIIALGLAWVWLSETPTRLQLLGAALVLTGVSLARLGKERTS